MNVRLVSYLGLCSLENGEVNSMSSFDFLIRTEERVRHC